MGKGSHKIAKDHKYLSLFTLDKAIIDLKGVKYPLENCHFTVSDTYLTSNEIINDTAELIIKKGSVIVVSSNDK